MNDVSWQTENTRDQRRSRRVSLLLWLLPHLILAAVAACFLYAAWLQVPIVHPRPAAVLATELGAVEQRDGLKFVEVSQRKEIAHTRRRTIVGPLGPRADVARFESIVLDELAIYPSSLLKATGLRRICLVGDVLVDDVSFGGMSVPELHALYLKVPGDGAPNPVTVRRSFHHEMGHLLDFAARHDAGWSAWEKTNPAGFSYEQGGSWSWEERANGQPQRGHVGFVSPYAGASLGEDIAETYSCLVVFPSYCAARAARERGLAAKVNLVRGAVARLSASGAAQLWAKAATHAGPPRPATKALDPDADVAMYSELARYVTRR